MYFGFRVNYLHSRLKWLIEIEFVMKNVNIFYLDKRSGEHTIFKYRKNKCHAHKENENLSQTESFNDLSDFKLDGKNRKMQRFLFSH